MYFLFISIDLSHYSRHKSVKIQLPKMNSLVEKDTFQKDKKNND